MFSQANKRRVWWPVVFVTYNEAGERVEHARRFLFEPMPRKEYQAHRREAMKRQAQAVHFATRDLQTRFAGVKTTDPEAQLAEFERIAAEAIDAALQRFDADAEQADAELATVAARVHDWRGFTDPDATEPTPTPFSAAALEALLAYEDHARTVLDAFDACCRGAVAKN